MWGEQTMGEENSEAPARKLPASDERGSIGLRQACGSRVAKKSCIPPLCEWKTWAWEVQRSLRSQRSIGNPGMLNTQGCLFKREGCIICFPPRRLGADMINSLVTFEISVWLRPHPPPLDPHQELANVQNLSLWKVSHGIHL